MHRGGVGDSVLLWPMLRSLMREHGRVVLVSDAEKAQLAARALGVEAQDAEQRRFVSLWFEGGPTESIEGVARVISFVSSPCGPAARTWARNAALLFSGAEVVVMEERPDRQFALRFGGSTGVTPSAQGPKPCSILFHVGAGSREKTWEIARWIELADAVRAGRESHGPEQAVRVVLVAGEAEAERFSANERSAFTSAGGIFLTRLDELCDHVESADAVVAADTGAGHLAAQMGVRTLSLFGPTDPERWAPVGPEARVIRSSTGRMADLTVREVVSALSRTHPPSACSV